MTERIHISVIVPLFDEEPNVRPLVAAVRDALADGPAWELILVDDGSRDGTAERARDAAKADPHVRLLRLARNYGQTTATQAGFDHAQGKFVVSMDGDLQNDPLDIPRLVAQLEGGYDLVVGYREGRQDPFLTRRVPSWAANRLIQLVSGVHIRDNGCSLKAYRRGLLESLHLYSEMHRFIPAIAAATASVRITEIPVRHHARLFGKSKYGLSRIWSVLADLMTVTMIRWFRDRPLIMFGFGSALVGALGFVFAVSVAIWALAGGLAAQPVVLPAVVLLWFGLAVYLLMLGLVAEVALRKQREARSSLFPFMTEKEA